MTRLHQDGVFMAHAHVLIADDDELTLEMLDAALQDDHQVTLAHSGGEALSLAKGHAFDVVLLDVDMPGMDGYSTCAELKADAATAELPVIFLSAKVTLEERLRGYRAGAQDYLTKPFDVDELSAKIALAVENRERQKQLCSQVEEAMNAAMTTANMYGEVGVVLQLQRALSDCANYEDIATAYMGALAMMGFEGCLRLTGKLGTMSRTALAPCSALENSILDHLADLKGPAIQPVGEDHTCYCYGSTLLLVQNLPMSPKMDVVGADEYERFARARDNVALLAEGIVARMRALDVEANNNHLERARELVECTREALADISAQQHANRMNMSKILHQLNFEIEQSFVLLALTEEQEEQLSTTLRRHIHEALSVFDNDSEIDDHMRNLIARLHA
jgi:CheY-like chemotaxis protein